MVSKFALLINLLLASAALAAPSSRLAERIARRRANRRSQPLKRVDTPAGGISNVEYSSSWAGAVWDEGYGTFTTVTGIFTVPTLSSEAGSAASTWVGIDGDTCWGVVLRTGVDLTVSSDGGTEYDAWCEWYPNPTVDFSGISISVNDVINATVHAYSTTYGIMIIENQSTGIVGWQEITSAYPLCEQDAEWVVENLSQDGIVAPLADFGTVTFTSATASGPSGTTYTPSEPGSGATIVEIEENNQTLTSVSISGDSVTIQYI